MQKELLIIGQGLAGTMLSMRLWERGKSFKVIDDPSLSQASRIAAGLANPVVLKRQKWVADAELYLSQAPSFYRKYEDQLKTTFFHPVNLEHVFHQAGEVNDWQSNSEKPFLKDHLGKIVNTQLDHISSPHGRGAVEGIFWLDTVHFIEEWKRFLRKENLLVEDRWPVDDNSKNRPTIYCTGQGLVKSHPQLKSVFTPTKGEVMLIKSEDLPPEIVLHAGVFCLPLGNKLFKVGATYSHKQLDQETTKEGLEFLKSKLEVFFKGKYQVIEQLAGVRPNIKDRKPLMGRLSDSEWTFNGFGSRGVLMGPYLSKQFTEHLLDGKALAPQWDIARFT